MKKTYIKVIWREIKGSFGRFAAIFGIVALGVGFLSGLLVTTPDMHNSVDDYYRSNNMADIFIKATMGLTEGDLEEVRKIEELKDIMPTYVTDTLMETSNNELLATRVYGLPIVDAREEEQVNRLVLLEGRLPENENEALIERGSPFLSQIDIGTVLTISKENENYSDIEDTYSFKYVEIVGVVGNTFHFSKERETTNIGNGRLGAIIYVDRSSYNLDVFTDFYITARDSTSLNSFSSAYENYISKITKNLKEVGEERSTLRFHEIKNIAYDKLMDGYRELEEGKLEAEIELADAEEKLLDGQRELTNAYLKIQDGRNKLNDGKDELEENRLKALEEIALGEEELQDALVKLQKGDRELGDALVKLQDGERELNSGREDLSKGEKEYKDGLNEYNLALEEITQGRAQLEDAKLKLSDGIAELEEGKRSLADGEAQLDAGRLELEAGEEEYESGLEQVQEARAELDRVLTPVADSLGVSVPELIQMADDYDPGDTTEIDQALQELRDEFYQVRDDIDEIEYIRERLDELKANPDLDEEALTRIEELEQELDRLEPLLPGLYEELDSLELEITSVQDGIDQVVSGYGALEEAERQLQDARVELDKGWVDYYKGVEELNAGYEEIQKAEKEIEDGRRQIEENEQLIIEGERELAEAKIKLDDAKKEIDDGVEELKKAEIELKDGYLEYEKGKADLEAGWEEYYDGLSKLEDAKITFSEEMEKAEAEISKAEIELQDGIRKYEKGVRELRDGREEYDDAIIEVREMLEEGRIELLNAEDEIKDIEQPMWYVLDRNHNLSFVSFSLNADKVAAISKVFPIFFYLVAGLVSLTTMTRMVEEERTQIGVLKALGYKKKTITFKYLIYSGLASVLGSIAGQLVGFKLLPLVLWNAYGIMYHLPPFLSQYNFRISLISSGFAILATMGATVYSVNQALAEKPSTLMLPRAPKAGKRIILERVSFIWKRMSFSQKATARNLFRYKKHFYMTIIGISGCTALLLTGFGLRDSIGDLAITQFESIFSYDIEIELDDKKANDSDLISILEDETHIDSYLMVYTNKGSASYEDEFLEATLIVPKSQSEIDSFIRLNNRKTGEKLQLKEDEVIISEKLSEVLGLKLGDELSYETTNDKTFSLTVGGITENYLGNYIYMTSSNFEKVLGDDIAYNNVFVKTSLDDLESKENLISELLSLESVLNAEIIAQARNTFANLVESIDYIVVVIILASGLLAFIVLYNLTNININERKKELATLKVLGYHLREVSNYIFKEITILTIFGILVGLILGKFLHSFIIVTVENPDFMFGRDIVFSSYALSMIVTLVFSFIVNIFMSKKIKNIKMVDSLKAND